jgi:hypothetical protein
MTREEQEDALEAAKLAAFVGSQLNAVDQLFTDRNNIPANKIDINQFVAKVKNPNANIQPASYLTNIPRGFAAPPSEDQIRQMVPDHVSALPSVAPQAQEIPVSLPVAVAPIENKQPTITPLGSPKTKATPKAVEQTLLTRSDIDSIRNSLKGIDKSLSNMLDLLKNSKLTTND